MTMDEIPYDHVQPEGAFPVLIFPHPSHIFLNRSRRFAALAEGHSLADWLRFLGRLTQVQHELLQEYQSLPLADETALAFAWKHRLPPIPAASWPRDPFWRKTLAGLARELAPHAPPPARDTLDLLQAMDGATLEDLADRVLRFELDGQQTDFLPFIAAALQVHWTALAAGLNRMKIGPIDVPGICPCCGFLPVASIVHMNSEAARLRYLHCALCNTEWHLVRVTCAACRDSSHMVYQYIEGSDRAVRAETCDACKSYLKIFYQEKSPQVDPIADDLSTLALDLLLEGAGYDRMSPNLLFTPCRDSGFDKLGVYPV